MRISDWSSDVCSSDLPPACGRGLGRACNGHPPHEHSLPQPLPQAGGEDRSMTDNTDLPVKDQAAHDAAAKVADYEHGWSSTIETDFAPKGLTEETVRFISAKKIGRASCRERVGPYG